MRSPSEFLPTPIVSDANGAVSNPQERGMMLQLRDLPNMLPTPTANLSTSGVDNARAGRERSGTDDLTTVADTLLPTPTAALASGGQTSRSGARKDEPLLSGIAEALLPTPTTDPDTGNGHARNLGQEARLLPTPIVGDARGARNSTVDRPAGKTGHEGDTLTDAVSLLPTPSVQNSHGNEENGRGERLLPGVAHDLLPTPVAHDSGNPPDVHLRKKPGRKTVTSLQVMADYDLISRGGDPTAEPAEATRNGIDWGKYLSAIVRAEAASGRTAPDPTLPDGKGGKRRLSSRFVEWMMLLPLGWVTGHGLTRAKELERLGNGVVPAQAAYATVLAVHRLTAMKAGR